MYIPIATKGYENLFVVLANRKRVDVSPYAALKVALIVLCLKMEYVICILA